MRGAGTHQIQAKSYRFSRRSSDASSAGRSSGFMDEFLAKPSRQSQERGDDRDGLPSWIEQRRMERRRGAGTHAIQRRSIAFGLPSNRLSNASSSAMSESIMEEEEEEEDDDVDEALGDGEEHNITVDSFSAPMQSTPKRLQLKNAVSADINYGGDDQNYPQNDADEVYEPQMDVYMDMSVDGGNMGITESPGSIAAQRAMSKRKSKRQASPRRTVQRKATKTMLKGKKGPGRRVIDIAADETIAGQADLTMEEQREAAFTAPEPPNWTFPKKPVTLEELFKMKEKVKEVITLALGNEAGIGRKGVKFNDADVLWVEIKRVLQKEQQGQSQLIQSTFNQLLDSLLESFTHLSQQSAERSRLVHHLQQARKRNLLIRKQLFKKRSHVLQINRTMQVLKSQELKRVQREEDEEKSLQFLSQLQQVSHEWC